MIIFINGAFGVGKTTVAELLQSKLANSMIYDPELVGGMLRYMTQEVLTTGENTDDFQDIALWPTLTVEIAKQVQQQYQRHLIIPMTITNREYFGTITEGLRQIDADFHHFCLLASRDTIRERLIKQGHEPGDWVFRQMERCVMELETAVFQTHLDTDNRQPDKLANMILAEIEK